MIDTPVSWSLGATFSELIGQPTPLELKASLPTSIAPVIEMIPSSEPQPQPVIQPPLIVTTTLEAPTTVADVTPIETTSEPQV